MSAFRCSAASLDRAEPIAGSASTVRRFLLVECPGPWGREAVRDSRLPAEVAAWLRIAAREHGIRVLLIRRPGRRSEPGVAVFAASVQPRAVWMERAHFDTPEEVCDLDAAALGAGQSLGLTRTVEPLFLVCTHGRHDACCAEKGRPVAAALAVAEPDATWEVSHIGGDRFAGNVLVLPDGLYYGRLDPEAAARMAQKHRAGALDLSHLRGRSSYPFDVQAAEVQLRDRLQTYGRDELTWVSRDREGELSVVVFEVTGRGRWRIVVRQGQARSTQLTCGAVVESAAPTFDLEAVAQI